MFPSEDEPGKQVRSAIGIKNTCKAHTAFKVRTLVYLYWLSFSVFDINMQPVLHSFLKYIFLWDNFHRRETGRICMMYATCFNSISIVPDQITRQTHCSFFWFLFEIRCFNFQLKMFEEFSFKLSWDFTKGFISI